MKLIRKTFRRRCWDCGELSTVTVEEPELEIGGEHSRWVEAIGCWKVVGGKLVHECEQPDE